MSERPTDWEFLFRRDEQRIAELEAEVERLAVCGTCGLYLEKGVTGTDEYPWCDADDDELVACGTNDSCHFTPPRWKPYWKEER